MSTRGAAPLLGHRLDDRWPATAIVIWLLAAVVLALSLPLLPIDETRYMTVAWEMRLSQHWLLPTLNGEAYSHKPPLLIWLINLAWTIGGTEAGVARAVPALVSAGVLLVTYRLARALFPDDRDTAVIASLLTLVPAYFVYGALLMFDQLLTLWVILGLVAIWRAARDPKLANWLLLGLAIGFGMLTKGPVVLLHLLPVACAVRVWQPEGSTPVAASRWILGLLGAVALGTAIILAWAVPAAISGGPEFARMIFWEQSAGRMVKSFAHRLPVWFYLPVLAGFLAPLLMWGPLWRGLGAQRGRPLPQPVKFLLIWIVVDIVAFSLISGKQPHYLLPLLPGFAIVAAWLVGHVEVEPRDRRNATLLAVIPFAILTLGPILAPYIAKDTATKLIGDGIANFNPLLSLLAGALASIALYGAKSIKHQAKALALASALLISTVVVQVENHVFRLYDLAPVAKYLSEHEQEGPIAYVGDYHGELGFLARLHRPLEIIEAADVDAWLAKNPNGMAVSRRKLDLSDGSYDVLFEMPYRAKERFVVLRKPGGT